MDTVKSSQCIYVEHVKTTVLYKYTDIESDIKFITLYIYKV